MMTLYSWDEIPHEGLVVIRECFKTGKPLPSHLDNCKECEHLLGFVETPPASEEIWEYTVACRVPLLRSGLKIRTEGEVR